ncbi:hypothetical protein [Streptomyces sp. MW-W600-10]|uniref:hypothetical protein n=1 Tax=Streptomyces sp. MW-W600-10 TaxID=2829819 RepID=UPI001C44AE1B|nr:hypothetical protein [Streptomyces sp. MW-W600-10]MBV7249289.1 hypothetical protein [Streptomyces sp. MW-W600-10]
MLSAYTTSWEEQTKAYAKASSQGTGLKTVTSLNALSDIESDLSSLRESGRVTQGKPVIAPEVTALGWKKIPEATVTDCVDISGWVLIDRKSKKEVPLPAERRTKYVSTAKLERWGKKWMVTQLTAQDRGC